MGSRRKGAYMVDETVCKRHHDLAQELVDEVANSSNPKLDPILDQVEDLKLLIAILAARVVDVRIDCDDAVHALESRIVVQDGVIDVLHTRVRELRGDLAAV